MRACVRAHAHTHVGQLCEKDCDSGEGEEGDEESDTKRVQHEPTSPAGYSWVPSAHTIIDKIELRATEHRDNVRPVL